MADNAEPSTTVESTSKTLSPIFTFATEGIEDILLQNLAITPATAIAIYLAFCIWYSIIFVSIICFIIKRTNWSTKMDFALYGRHSKSKAETAIEYDRKRSMVIPAGSQSIILQKKPLNTFPNLNQEKHMNPIREQADRKPPDKPVVVDVEP